MQGVGIDSGSEPLSAQRRLSLLVAASGHLAGSLDLRAMARGLAASLVPHLADQAEVDLVESLFHLDTPADPRSDVLCRVALVDRGAPDGHGKDEWVAYPAGSPAARALTSGRTQLAPQAAGEAREMYVPLKARGRVLGLVGLRRLGGEPYLRGDLSLVEEIASRAALAVDNVRLYDEARVTSITLQRSLLPTVQPRLTGVTTAHRYLPGLRDVGVGGDWFDVIPLSCGRVGLVIGDVMGRGLRAAAAMGQLRTAVRTLAVLDHPPEDLLRHLDDVAQGTDVVQLATCGYAVFDPVDRLLTYATAGHPPPMLRSPDGSTTVLPQPSGAPLGVGGVPFESATVAVPDGARLLLYTDGLVESPGEDIDRGLTDLAAAFGVDAGPLESLCDTLLAATGRGQGYHDDVALLVAELSGLPADRTATWRLTGGGEQVAHARAHVRGWMLGWEVAALTEAATLLASELVTNALRHARMPILLQGLLLDEIVTLAVHDCEIALPRLRRSVVSDEGGRGLQLVSQVANRWGARPTTEGKVVWCDLLRPRGPRR